MVSEQEQLWLARMAQIFVWMIILVVGPYYCRAEEGWNRGSWSSNNRIPNTRQEQGQYQYQLVPVNQYQQQQQQPLVPPYQPYLPDDAEDLPYPYLPSNYPPSTYPPNYPNNQNTPLYPFPQPFPPPPTPLPLNNSSLNQPRPIGYLLVDTRKTLGGLRRTPLAFFRTVP